MAESNSSANNAPQQARKQAGGDHAARKTAVPPTGQRASYKQGAKKGYGEPLENSIAVRYCDGAEPTVREALGPDAKVQATEPQRLLVADFPDAASRDAALDRLLQLVDKGLVEFATPVLLDPSSQLRQIPTDEITVRFKSPLPEDQLKSFEQKYGVSVVRQNEFVPNQYIMKVARPVGLHTLDVANELNPEEDVEFATPNFISEYRR
ncbi:MAG: hypothetical protein ACJ78Q_06610 [Chloroflexia bacterium]